MLVEPAPKSATEFDREVRKASLVSLPAGNSSTATSEGGSAAVCLRELEIKEKRAEREERQAEREAEQRRLEAEEGKAAREAKAQKLALEAEEKRRAMALEERKLEMEERRRELEVTVAREQAERDARLKAEQLRVEHEIRLEELKARQAKPGNGGGVDGQTQSDPNGAANLALQTKRFGKMMRHVLPKMPLESAAAPII